MKKMKEEQDEKQRKIDIEKIHRPKRAKVLPNVLSKEEVKVILGAHSNLKHKIMLCLIYSCGLRCGELLALKPVNIDSKRTIVRTTLETDGLENMLQKMIPSVPQNNTVVAPNNTIQNASNTTVLPKMTNRNLDETIYSLKNVY